MSHFFLKIFFVFLVLILFTGCEGEDGEDGRAAIAYSWSGDVTNVVTDDPTIPYYFTNGMYYYYATPGVYYYSYNSNYDYWYGTWDSYSGYYTIYEEEGEEGDIFWEDGDDGEDMCFELYMYAYIGPSFYEWTCDYEGVDLPRSSTAYDSPALSRYLQDQEDERNNYEEGHNVVVSESIEQIEFDDSFNKNDMIMEIDNDPNVITETGRIGKYSYIHKYIKK